jgi:hypothetical protein
LTIIERFVKVYEDEKREKPVLVRSFEISGVTLPKEKSVPVIVRMSWCRPLYLSCSHHDADVFVGFPISLWSFVKLKWHRLWK